MFASASPSTSALSDSVDWITRLRRAFGSPNFTCSMELCGWGRFLASTYTFGAPVPGAFMPDLESAGCILFWGYNPSVSRLVHATATVEALNRGARLVVVDPRRTGLAGKAEHWLQVRPGTDAALALGLIRVMLERGWYDEEFVRRCTNAPLLVRTDTGRLLRAERTGPGPRLRPGYVAWDRSASEPVVYDPARAVVRRRARHGSRCREPSRWPRSTGGSAAVRCSNTCASHCAADDPRRRPRPSPGCPPTRSWTPRTRCGPRDRWRSTAGAAWSSTATRRR